MYRDAFDVMGLPPRFDLAPAVLQAAYLALSAKVHPDAAGAPAQSAGDPETEGKAAELNAAKRTLENPETRADLLLRRLGGPTKEQDKSLPQSFLMEMLETREEIEAAVASKDPAAIERWQDWAAERRRAHIAAVKALFEDLLKQPETTGGGTAQASPPALAPPANAAALKAIRAELNMWRYIERLIEQLDESV